MSFMKKNAGFTLVELIVVIAILGILAGVAIPTYSGYIEKAQIAGDQQELHNVNLAFAAACAEAGESNFGRTDVSGGIQGGKFVYSAPFAESFGLYYPAADAGEFKVMTSVIYDRGTGAFVDNSDGTAQLKQYFDNSSFKGNMSVITTQVDKVTNSLSDSLGGGIVSIEGTGFQAYLNELGIAADDTDAQAEAAILYLAQNAADMDKTKINAVNTAITDIILAAAEGGNQDWEALNTATGSSLASAAAIYAVAEGLALQQGEDSDAYKALHNATLTDVNSVMTALGTVVSSTDDAELGSYLTNGIAPDLDAYYGALQAVNGQQSVLEEEVKKGNSVVDSDVIKDLIAKVDGN